MSLRLLIVTEGYPCQSNMAGAFHLEQFRMIAQAGIDVSVVVPVPWVPPGMGQASLRWKKFRELPLLQHDQGVRVLRPRYFALPRENLKFFPDITRHWALQGLSLERPDVIQSYFAVPSGAAAQKLARNWGVAHCVGMLGDDVNVYPKNNSRNRRLLREVLRDAAFAFANGPTLADTAERLTGIAVSTLSIGVSSTRFQNLPGRNEAREVLRLPKDKKLALYVGALSHSKGIGDLCNALDGLSHEILLIAIGDGPLRSELERRENAFCLGVRQVDDVTRAMAAADLFVHPSHHEGLPTVLIEAALAQLPIVTTDAPGCIDLARSDRALMFPVGDAARLAGAITEVLADPEAARTRVARMLSHVRKFYDLETNTTKLIKTYRRLSAGGKIVQE